MVKIRLISDLHYSEGLNGRERNKTAQHSGLYSYFGKRFLREQDCVTLIAGDLSDTVENHRELLETFFPNQRVLFTGGNHICYYENKDGSKPILSKVKENLKEAFPLDNLYTYLENDWTWIPGTDIAVIGSTFYTDYAYCDLTLEEFHEHLKNWDKALVVWGFPSKLTELPKKLTKSVIRTETMFKASYYLNDFNWGKENEFTKLTPNYYLQLHKESKEKVKQCYDHILSINPNAKIILMTHHCLSPKVIEKAFEKKLTNASYVSDLEKWLEKMPRIRLIHSGHVHCRKDFTFGKHNQRYIVNACGYITCNEPFNKPIKFNPNLIIDTDDL